MKTLFKLSGCSAALVGGVMSCVSFNAMAVDFDTEGVVVDGIKYGIVGVEAPYKAYVVQTDMFDDDFEYEGEMVIPGTIVFDDDNIAVVEGIDDKAFYGSDVTSVTIPNSVLTIGKQAFGLCSKLTTVRIGSGVSEILSKAFYPDAKLTTIFIDAIVPPAIASDALMNAPEKMTLYVPSESVEAYRTAAVWNTIGSILAQDNFVKVTEIKVSPSVANVSEMGTLKLTAEVYPAEASQHVLWTSSDSRVARVSSNGEVFGVRNGMCTVTATATDGSGVKGECLVVVGSGKVLEVSMPYISGYVGEEYRVRATVSPEDTTVEWSVSDNAVAEVVPDGLYATVTLKAPGNTIIKLIASNGLSQEIEVNVKALVKLTAIEVNPDMIECEVGDRINMWEFDVRPVPENVSEFYPSVRIEDRNIIDYDPDDFDYETLECLAPGTTRIIWSQGDIESYCTIVVAGEIKLTGIILTPEIVSGAYEVGDEIWIMATPIPADATDFNPEWSSSDENVATVDDNGIVTVVNPENDVVITCTSGIFSANCKIYFESTGVGEVTGEDSGYSIVSIDGAVIKKNASVKDLDSLLPGLYIINGKKHIKR